LTTTTTITTTTTTTNTTTTGATGATVIGVQLQRLARRRRRQVCVVGLPNLHCRLSRARVCSVCRCVSCRSGCMIRCVRLCVSERVSVLVSQIWQALTDHV
jgi:hypothetical protein